MHYNSEKPNCPLLYLATADYAVHYRPESLSAQDAKRARKRPQLHTKPDWQTSRALLALCTAAPYRSISHSQGCATVFAAATPNIGTDIEVMRERNFDVWLQHVFSDSERMWLHGQTNFAAACYALWTLKEALLKACGKELADIRNVGLIPNIVSGSLKQAAAPETQQWLLHNNGTVGWHGSVWRLGTDTIAAAVWPHDAAKPQIVRLGQAATLPLQKLCGFQAA